MWKAKFSVYDEKAVYASRAKKFNVSVHGYMLNYHSDKKYFYFTLLAFVEGSDRLRKEFIEDLRKDKKIHYFENHNYFFVCTLKHTRTKEKERHGSLFYNPLLIQTKPFIIYPSGWEELELASFNRKYLENIMKIAEKKFNLKLEYLKKGELDSLGILSIFPKLTEKQKNAVESAISNGYYEYPRKIDVQSLAKKNKSSFSTFQEHLRKAENKLIPFSVKKSE